MVYPEEIVLKELMWEYDYSSTQAQSIIDLYKSRNKYSELCDFIQYRLSRKLLKEELYVGESDV